MEDTLRGDIEASTLEFGSVLILVLMEDTLRVVTAVEIPGALTES